MTQRHLPSRGGTNLVGLTEPWVSKWLRQEVQVHRETLDSLLGAIAEAGFDPAPTERVGGRLAGLLWQGNVLQGRDRLPSAEVHYLRHCVHVAEWPSGTTFADYVSSIREVFLDSTSGILISTYHGEPQLMAVRHSRHLRGPAGNIWLVADFRASRGFWTTAYQPIDLGKDLVVPQRGSARWLRLPRP